jgi:CRISPR-associated protein Csb2
MESLRRRNQNKSTDGPVLPLVIDTVRVAEAFRAALRSRFEAWCRQQATADVERFRRNDRPQRYSSAVLSGKDADGVVVKSHGHAHFLPTTEGDDRRRITHLTAYAPDGFAPPELAALTAVRGVAVGERKLRVQLIGLGRPADFRAPLFVPSRQWLSVTPFVAHRHRKRRGQKKDAPLPLAADPRSAFVELAVRELVERSGIGRLTALESVQPATGEPRGIEFHRRRTRPGDDGSRRAWGFLQLTFVDPLDGPLCLGYGSHYGLGLFRRSDNEK